MLQKINYFDIFNLPTNFQINKNDLKQKYYKLCRNSHPDSKHYDKSTDFNLINKAYNILNNDLKRAEHLAELKGKKFDQKLSNKFFEKIMKLEENRNQSVIDYCNKKINKYKENYDNLKALQKWKYYDRIVNGWEL